MSPLDDFDFDDAIDATGGRAEHKRRLSDKILAAFNHAYAVGEIEVADKLRGALAANVGTQADANQVNGGNRRAGYDPLGQADLWVAFVEARNGYKKACEMAGADASAIASALETMKEAYCRWSTA